ncbi:MAG: hypothetical protein LBT53_10275 [Puniceicoccales bacterium]|jgi:hypothetical protein|nr:hypothetical protein [Puniceicoccales bacterium]
MQPKAFVTTLALSLLGFSVSNTLAPLLLGKNLALSGILSFVINLVLAVFMIRGANWARWVTLMRLIVGIIFGFAQWLAIGRSELDFFSLLLVCVRSGAETLFFIYLAGNLLFSKRVNEHFGT